VNAGTLTRLASDPREFRKALRIDADGGPRTLEGCLDDWQRRDFEALDTCWSAVATGRGEPRYRRAWLERPRGHSKTGDLAVMVSWCLFASRRQLAGVAAAADKDQARLLRDAIAKLVNLNGWLGNVLDCQAYRVVNRHTGSALEIISSDTASSYGLTPDFLALDEITHWQRRDLFDSLFSSAAKRANCLVVSICNAGFGDTWQAGLAEAVRSDPAWYVSVLDGPRASWISEKHLAEQRRLLPAIAFERLWLNRWSAGAGDALNESDIAAAITLPGPLQKPERGWVYYAGLDLGLSRDASALAVVGRHVGYRERLPEPARPKLPSTIEAMVDLGLIETKVDSAAQYRQVNGSGRLRLAELRIWRHTGDGERVSITEIEQAILALRERLGIAALAADPWQAALLIERLRKQGLAVEQVDFTPINLRSMCSATLEAFTEQQLDLYQHDQLLTDLRALRVEERQYGVRLVSPRGPNGHGDSATALSLALHLAKRNYRPAARVERPLLCWPWPASRWAISLRAPSIGKSKPSSRLVIDGCRSMPGGNSLPASIALLYASTSCHRPLPCRSFLHVSRSAALLQRALMVPLKQTYVRFPTWRRNSRRHLLSLLGNGHLSSSIVTVISMYCSHPLSESTRR